MSNIGIIKGNNYLLSVKSGSTYLPLGHLTGTQITRGYELETIASKTYGNRTKYSPGGKTKSLSSEGFLVYERTFTEDEIEYIGSQILEDIHEAQTKNEYRLSGRGESVATGVKEEIGDCFWDFEAYLDKFDQGFPIGGASTYSINLTVDGDITRKNKTA